MPSVRTTAQTIAPAPIALAREETRAASLRKPASRPSIAASSEKKAMNSEIRFQPRMSRVTKKAIRLERPPIVASTKDSDTPRAAGR